jgi:photosystem II stability/assembly factor-like uncharacterized protein
MCPFEKRLPIVAMVFLWVGATVPVSGQGPVTRDDNDDNNVFDPALYDGLKYRMVGPYRGGRVTAVTGVPTNPYTFYMGSTGGGVWKSTNAGGSWTNVTDDHVEVGSIGAIAVADSDANVVFVGTGSACARGNVSVGNGVYKSTDAGKSWTHVGLPQAGQIGRVRVHPANPDLVYVAALGHIFGPNEERGVFRSKDGGGTWEKVLFVSARTGAVDLSMNPSNPRELYAAMWTAERKPWTLVDGSEEGGLYHTVDGGDNWEKVSDGIPQGLVGRIGVSISPANPERVFALVTAKDDEGGLYRTDDGGESWSRITGDRRLRARGWYYTHVVADPQDENTVYIMNNGFYKSVDGGKTFESIRTPHGDNHDLWIHPDRPEIMIEGNDGGANVTLDGARSWSSIYNQPTAEFYRVTVDDDFPYRMYGAQQDNSTISVPSWTSSGITPEQHWFAVEGGESGHIAVTPGNAELSYAGNYIGQIDRYDRRTGAWRNVIVYPQMADGVAPRDLKYRFQWNAPIHISPHDPNVVYHTSNYVHRSRDGGMSWETISPDLTTNDVTKQELPGGPLQHDHTGVEVYTTIFAFRESPHTAGVLWAGSDDGLVHLSRDNGTTWSNITPDDMPPDGTVNVIEISPHQAGRAFVAVYRYRMDDFTPYVFRTDDYGESWRLLTDGTNGIPANYPLRVVREDPDRRGLLYAGTEFGMFVSFDDGEHWQTLQLNLPVVPVTDLAVHRQDLVVATQGRSFWILDDLTPLHQLTEALADQERFLFRPRDAYRVNVGRFRGSRAPENPPAGAVIQYYLAQETEDSVSLEILDSAGEVVRRFVEKREDQDEEEGNGADDDEEAVLEVKEGMNRFVWDLLYPKPKLVEGAIMSISYTGGAAAPPGTYQVRLKVGEWTATQTFDVKKDPRRTDLTTADLDEGFRFTIQVRDKLTETHDAIRTIRSVRDQLKDVVTRARAAGIEGELAEVSEEITSQLTEIEEELIQVKNEVGSDPINFPPKLDNQLAYLYGHVNNSYGRPTEGSYRRFQDLEAELAPHFERLQSVLNEDLVRFNELVASQGGAAVMVPQPRPSHPGLGLGAPPHPLHRGLGIWGGERGRSPTA